MAHPKSSYPAHRHFVSAAYMIAALVITMFIALALMANSGNIYLFVRHDVLTNFDRLIFVCGFPVAYSVSLLTCHHLIKIPRFDFFNRIIFVNLIVYSFLGFLGFLAFGSL